MTGSNGQSAALCASKMDASRGRHALFPSLLVRRAGSVSLAFVMLATSCGSASGLLGGLLGRKRRTPTSSPVAVSDLALRTVPAKTSPVEFEFELTDTESDPADVDLRYQVPGGTPTPVLLTGETRLANLATSPDGVVHRRTWDFASQLPTGSALVRGVVLVVTVGGGNSQARSAPSDVGNDAPSVTVVSEPSSEVIGGVPVEIEVADSSSDLVDIAVEYDRFGDAAGWRTATGIGGSLTKLGTSPSRERVLFLWDAPRDEPGGEFSVRLRFTPTDGLATGATRETSTLLVDNNAIPLGIVNGSAFFANSDSRRGIAIPIQVNDDEGDAVNLAYQWRSAGGSFPALPSSWTEVATILADPTLRVQHQIASEFRVAESGRLIPSGGSAVRLPELSSRSVISAEYIVGRELEVHRGSRVPTGLAAQWSSNPLTHPVAIHPLRDGLTAIVMDRPAAGRWRLQEIRLADGTSVRTLAAGVDGEPDAMAAYPREAALLIATSIAGIWQLRRVEIATGVVSPWYTTSGLNATGSVRGLTVLDSTAAALTVADSVLFVDRTVPSNPTESVVLGGLATPSGVVTDPRNPRLVYVAERDWEDPNTSNPDGRVLALDLATAIHRTLTVSGLTLLHPTALAVDASATNLWFLADSDIADPFLELQAVRLNGGRGGPAFQLTGTLDASSTALALGPHALVITCVPPQNDLAAGGGLEQVRQITAFDGTSSLATVDAPFAPPVIPGKRWRIQDRADAIPAGATVRRDTFAWDSEDASVAGDVVLRITPYDADKGAATDTGVPRPIKTGLQVVPTIHGSASTNAGIRSLMLVDSQGDGLGDIVTANTGRDSVSVFFQNSPGEFSVTPDLTITGNLSSPMDGPVDVTFLDADGDGDLDLASANLVSDDVAVAVQVAPGSFAVTPVSLGTGSDPLSLAAGDLDGDQLADLVVANRGSDELQVFFQLPSGLFNPTPSLSLIDVTADGPADVAIADLDGDGDADVVAANEFGDTLTAYLQTSPGIFAQPASFVLGGNGVTDAPVSVTVADLDGDGLLDIASANRAGNNVTVFLQRVNKTFSAVPSEVLVSTLGPSQPLAVTAADVNGDSAFDLAVSDSAGRILVFVRDPIAGAFSATPVVVESGNSPDDLASVVTDDLNGDGRSDLLVANETDGSVAVYLQEGAGNFRGKQPSQTIGSPVDTRGVRSAVVVDLDADADLDLATANAGSGTLSIYPQLGPAAFATRPAQSIGTNATAGAWFVAAADLNGDGRIDLVSANSTAATVTVFFQNTAGGFSVAPDLVLGTPTLQSPRHVTAADLDADGDLDLICADQAANRLFAFRQTSTGVFTVNPWLTLGTDAATGSPNAVQAADLDNDGDVDIACSAEGSSKVSVFFQSAPGVFAAAPDLQLGSPAATPQVKGLVRAYVNDDDLPDLVCLHGSGDAVFVFLATAPGTYPATPNSILTDITISSPSAVEVRDLDGDSAPDLVVGSAGTGSLVMLQQLGHGVFPMDGVVFGGAGATDDASQLLLVDIDRDGDCDVVGVHPTLHRVTLFFNSH